MARRPWVTRVPRGVRARPLGLFTAVLCVLSGATVATGLAEPTQVTRVLDPALLHAWGGLLTAAGVALTWGLARTNIPAEKLGLRVLSILCLLWAAWTALAAGWAATTTVVLALLLVSLCEVRIGVIRTLLRPRPRLRLPHRDEDRP